MSGNFNELKDDSTVIDDTNTVDGITYNRKYLTN